MVYETYYKKHIPYDIIAITLITYVYFVFVVFFIGNALCKLAAMLVYTALFYTVLAKGVFHYTFRLRVDDAMVNSHLRETTVVKYHTDTNNVVAVSA